MFSYLAPEERVPTDHPLRPVRRMVDVALNALSPSFQEIYSTYGRPSIAPEKLLRALLLQVFVQGPERTDVDGTVGIQPVVPVVRGIEHG